MGASWGCFGEPSVTAEELRNDKVLVSAGAAGAATAVVAAAAAGPTTTGEWAAAAAAAVLMAEVLAATAVAAVLLVETLVATAIAAAMSMMACACSGIQQNKSDETTLDTKRPPCMHINRLKGSPFQGGRSHKR